MAAPKQSIKTPLSPLMWVNVRGQGKLKMNADDNGEPENYQYVAQAILTPEQAEKLNKQVDDFWRKNKPKGTGKRKFELVKEETKKVLDAEGKPKLDEDDEPIREKTGNYTIQFKTITVWPKDGKPNIVKVLGANGKPLSEDHPAIVDGIGNDTMGIIHGSLGISAYPGNEGVVAYLSGVQIKDSTLTAPSSDEIEAEEIEDDVADTEVESDGPEVQYMKIEAISDTTVDTNERYIQDLEDEIDQLQSANKLLLDKINKLKESHISKEMWDDLCKRYQMECNLNIPF